MLLRLRPDQRVPTKHMASVTDARKDATRDSLHVPIGRRRRPCPRRRVFPVPAYESQDDPSTVADQRVRQIPPAIVCESDYHHRSGGPDQFGEPGETLFGVHMMQRGDRHHSIEGASFKRYIKHVALEPLHWDTGVACPRPVENTRVEIEPDDVPHASLSQLRRQDAITTPHVQDALCTVRDRRQDHRVILKIGIPESV